MLQFSRALNIIDAHTAGEPVRVVMSGLPNIPGYTMLDKMNWFEKNLGGVRNFIMREPRGHRDMYGAVITPPVTDDGDAGVLFMHTTGQATMCGHGMIGVVTVLVGDGIVPSHEGENIVRIDAPAGRVTAAATVKDGRVTEVSFLNVPSFLYRDNIIVNVPGVGKVKAAISFGGDFYVFAAAEDFGIRVSPEYMEDIIRYSMWLKDWGNRELKVQHPTMPEINEIYGVIMTGAAEHRGRQWKSRETCIFSDRSVDRSPCGTGTAARMALLYGRGEMAPDETLENRSIIDTVFRASIDSTVEIGGFKGIIPRISGSAWITGFNKLVLDPTDPLSEGFII